MWILLVMVIAFIALFYLTVIHYPMKEAEAQYQKDKTETLKQPLFFIKIKFNNPLINNVTLSTIEHYIDDKRQYTEPSHERCTNRVESALKNGYLSYTDDDDSTVYYPMDEIESLIITEDKKEKAE